jgi:predicted nucleotidyltransferase
VSAGGVTKLDLFGSVLRSDFRAESDVEVLASFDDKYRPTLFTLVQMEEELRQLLGRRADPVVRQSVERTENFTRREHILAHPGHDMVSGRRESHPPALSELSGSLSTHSAPIVQPSGRTSRQ